MAGIGVDIMGGDHAPQVVLEGCTQAFEATKAGLGSVDIVVNNAGISQVAPFEEITDEVWPADLDLKLFAGVRARWLYQRSGHQCRWRSLCRHLMGRATH